VVEFINLDKYFNKGTVDELLLFDKFNFKVDKGEFVSIIGSNGSGKTTLLNMLAALWELMQVTLCLTARI
jgi:putative ABC transport system ATP-binding protein